MLAESLRQAIEQLRANRARTVLTLFGIVWGTALVILLVTWGVGMREVFVEQVSSGGRRMILFSGGRSSSGVGADRGGHEIRLTRDDCALVARSLPGAEHVSCMVARWDGTYVRTAADTRNVTAFGADPATAALLELDVGTGRFVGARDVSQRRRVAVLGPTLAKQLFGSSPAVGGRVEVSGIGFEVIGVLRPKPDQISLLGAPDDEKLFVPVTTFQGVFTGDDAVTFVGVVPRVGVDHTALTAQVRRVLAARHGFTGDDPDALTVFDAHNFIDLFKTLTSAFHVFVTAVAIVTLSIGGVGVMNILLLSVSERMREIGLRKAIGARRRDIVTQFLIEALFLTMSGGLVGIGIGCLLCFAAGKQGAQDVPAFLSLRIVFSSAGMLVALGLLAGLWPARLAVGVDPAIALRRR
jgi:putative ABC transport system permease protein